MIHIQRVARVHIILVAYVVVVAYVFHVHIVCTVVLLLLFIVLFLMLLLILSLLLYEIVGSLEDYIGVGCVDEVSGIHYELGRMRLNVHDDWITTFVAVDAFNRIFDVPLFTMIECRLFSFLDSYCDGGDGCGPPGVGVSEFACVDDGVL